ncbi:S-adenosylmethionine decarboxylase proenzyme [Caldisphaera lagunensis DSM 15908]|uniref:S-adenosylmethionine decarboxylase proenzyme n=1 Tax=Caldisphaera lagunensis (strain DSM 15908 / JCM 11604 / ANMR 0165 / IC-154) TaxID=1056495 RepID=L0A8Y4_CALLD|nr:adenosylmethionine decarboxylase [Caldisphaera lagunensis]AFZ70321.1 S-adenosylmethionine decarboxylase proenzyme [Caldisphaera lagunensis DSM 15908]
MQTAYRVEDDYEKKPKVVGRHIYGNIKGCKNISLLSDEKGLINLLNKAGQEGNMTILDVKAWKIGEGVSAVAIVLESHITIHTWPEYRFATVDVYSCGSHTDPKKAFDYIVNELNPEDVEFGITDRSLE